MSAGDITVLEARVRRDIEMTAHPRMDWMEPRLYQGKPALDVLIVGAGQSGLCIAFALIRDRVRNIQVIDRAPEGREGIWAGFARMPTLRSPKDQTGPDLGIPSLTFEAWYDAVRGAGSFAGLGLIPTGAWHDYLQWYRRVLALPVRNGVAATAIAPGQLDDGGRCLLVTLSTGELLAARKLVLATGQDGTGEWWMPDFVRALPTDRRAHTCEMIDFERLRGRTVAVLGAGASAMDNAAVALEHGAEVYLFCRRPEPGVVQRYRWLTFAGFLKHIGEMPDEWRWRVMGNIMRAREGFPADTSPCSSAARGPMRAWRRAASGSRRRAGRSTPTMRSAAPASARTWRCAPNLQRSPTKLRCGATATRRRRARKIRCSRTIPISVPTTPFSSARRARRRGWPTSTCSASGRP
jgi:cation diffusion facilitator CzcD-associated flavoprotein CzcO